MLEPGFAKKNKKLPTDDSFDQGSSRSNEQLPITRLIPLVDWNKFHVWPPIGGLRHMVFKGQSTGFSKVIKRCGRRVLIDEKKFFEFVEQKNQEKSAKTGN